jgi:hypothetical protein
MIAFCGLGCHECGAFLATQENDSQKREKVAQGWSSLFKVEIKPEDINCDGCQSDGGRLFNYCKVCEIRKCGQGKGVSILSSATLQMLGNVWIKSNPSLKAKIK